MAHEDERRSTNTGLLEQLLIMFPLLLLCDREAHTELNDYDFYFFFLISRVRSSVWFGLFVWLGGTNPYISVDIWLAGDLCLFALNDGIPKTRTINDSEWLSSFWGDNIFFAFIYIGYFYFQSSTALCFCIWIIHSISNRDISDLYIQFRVHPIEC